MAWHFGSLSRVKGCGGEILLQNIGGNFLLVITAAVPAALLQYKSHGKPRSSRCLLNTMPFWWLVSSSKRSKVCLLEAPSCSSSSLQSPLFLCAEHAQWERLGKEQSRKGTLTFLVDEDNFVKLCLRGSGREAVVSESASV